MESGDKITRICFRFGTRKLIHIAHTSDIMKFIPFIYCASVFSLFPCRQFDISYRQPFHRSTHLAIWLVNALAAMHHPQNLSIAGIILYNVYISLLQLKLEIGNVRPIKKFFNSSSGTLICNPYHFSGGAEHSHYKMEFASVNARPKFTRYKHGQTKAIDRQNYFRVCVMCVRALPTCSNFATTVEKWIATILTTTYASLMCFSYVWQL